MRAIKLGLSMELEWVVGEGDSPQYLEKMVPRFLSYKAMVNIMEKAAFDALAPYLKRGESSVGIGVRIRQLAPAPLGSKVKVRAVLVERKGRRCLFKVEAFHGRRRIGEGYHERFIVDLKRFTEQTLSKGSNP